MKHDMYTARAKTGQMYQQHRLAIRELGKAFFPSPSVLVLGCLILSRSLSQDTRLSLTPAALETRAIMFHWRTKRH